MALRNFRHQGMEWTVWDTHPETTPLGSRVAAGYDQGWLTFESEAEKRRLAPVPAEWFELPEGQLAALLERAAPVRRAPDMRF